MIKSSPMLKALIFDFDGLILDTETPEYRVWKNIYQEYGFDFPVAKWGSIIGGNGTSGFEPSEELSLLSQGRLNPDSLRVRHRLESDALVLSSTHFARCTGNDPRCKGCESQTCHCLQFAAFMGG